MAKRKRESSSRVSARRRAEERAEGGGTNYIELPEGFSFFSPDSEGPYKINFYPYKVGKGNPYAEEGEEHFERTFFVHKQIGPNNQTVICRAKTAKAACPICEDAQKQRMKEDADIDDDAIKALFPKERQLFVLDNLGDEEHGFQIWDISYHLFGKQLDGRIKDSDEEDEYEFFADLEGGSTLRVGFQEKSFKKNKFYEARSIDFKKRKAIDRKVLDEIPCLDDLIKVPDYEEVRKLYFQEPDDGDDAKDEKSSRGSAKSEAKDDDWDDDVPFEKEEEKPKDEPKAKSKADDKDDDDWDDW